MRRRPLRYGMPSNLNRTIGSHRGPAYSLARTLISNFREARSIASRASLTNVRYLPEGSFDQFTGATRPSGQAADRRQGLGRLVGRETGSIPEYPRRHGRRAYAT